MLASRVRMGSYKGNKYDDNSGSPGNNMLIAGDMTAGYFGEVSANELFTEIEISNLCGITEGGLVEGTGWLKFASNGKIIFRSMKPCRHSISYIHLNLKNCVNGTKIISKDGVNYKVRLMSSSTVNPSGVISGTLINNSEWNKLMLPINIKAKEQTWQSPTHLSVPSDYWGIDFTDADLGHLYIPEVASEWCMETYFSDYILIRGSNGYGIERCNGMKDYSIVNAGWFPVLELV